MSDPCDDVVERLALGEPLGDATAHAARCPRCTAVVALPVELARAGRADPGVGFSARVVVGAQRRLVARKRRRMGTSAFVAVVAVALGVFAATRPSSTPDAAEEVSRPATHRPPITATPASDSVAEPVKPDEVRQLVHLARVDRARHVSAHWARIESSLAPYRALVKGAMP